MRESLESLKMDEESIEERLRGLDKPADDCLEALDKVLEELSTLAGEERLNQAWLVLHKRALVLAADIRLQRLASTKPHEEQLEVVRKKLRYERFGC